MEKWLKHFWRLLRLKHSLLVLHPGNNNPYKLLLPIKKYTYEHNATSPDITICALSTYTQITIFHRELSTWKARDSVNHSPHHRPSPAITTLLLPAPQRSLLPVVTTFRNPCKLISHPDHCLTTNTGTSTPHVWCSLHTKDETIKAYLYANVSLKGWCVCPQYTSVSQFLNENYTFILYILTFHSAGHPQGTHMYLVTWLIRLPQLFEEWISPHQK